VILINEARMSARIIQPFSNLGLKTSTVQNLLLHALPCSAKGNRSKRSGAYPPWPEQTTAKELMT
jgi:hypothetical protein